MEAAEVVRRALGAWALPALSLVALICLLVAFDKGERPTDDDFAKRFRKRASHLRWLCISCLALNGALAVAGIAAIRAEAQLAAALGSAVIVALLVALLASVCRYVLRLACFYESRADALELLRGKAKPSIVNESHSSIHALAQLLAVLSPDAAEYPGRSEASKPAVDTTRARK